MINKFFVLILLVVVSFVACGQTFLVLEKMGTKKRYEYHIGDKIEVMLNDDDFYTRISILGLEDSIILAKNQSIKLSSIKAIHLNHKNNFFRISGPTLMIAGVLLFAIDAFNQAVVQGGGYSNSPGVTAASVSLVGLGAVFTFAGRNKVKVKKWWRLRIVDI
jgi:hypothetical protein